MCLNPLGREPPTWTRPLAVAVAGLAAVLLVASLAVVSGGAATGGPPAVVDGHDTVGLETVGADAFSSYGLYSATEPDEPPVEWAFDAGSTVTSSPTIVDGTVYVGIAGGDGHVYALDAATGDEEWAFETGGGISSSPFVDDGTVYIGSSDNHLYAIDAESGTEEWSFEADHTVNSPFLYDGTVYVSSWDENIYAVDAETGEEEWIFETGDTVRSSPTVVDGTVYVGSQDGHLYALDATSGDEEWAFETDDEVRSSPTVYNETVYAGSWDGNMYALDAQSGAYVWSYSVGDNNISPSPTVANDTLYFGSHSNNVYALNASTGEFVWSRATFNNVLSSPTVADDTVYVGSSDANLYALDARTGAKHWAFETDDEFGILTTGPTVVDGTVYFGSRDDHIYALETGSEGSSVDSRVLLGTLGHHDVEVVPTGLSSFEVEPVSDTIVQGEPLEVEFVNAVDVDGEPYTTGDDTWTNIDVEHPLDDDPRRVAVEFVDGEALHTFEVLDGDETDNLDVDTYEELEAWDVNDPRISDTYDIDVVATRLVSFEVEPVSDSIVQGEPMEVEFVNAVDVDGEPYTTGDDTWTNIDVEHPLDDDPRRVAVEFVDGEALHTFEVLESEETEGLNVDTYEELEAWDVNDPRISDTYDIEVVATRLASFDVEPVTDAVLQGEPLEVEFVNAVDVHGEPYTTGDDAWTNIDVEHPHDDDPRRVAVEFVDGEALHTFEVLDGDETDELELGEHNSLGAWDVNDPRISDTYDVEIVATRLASFDVQPETDPVVQGEPLEVEFVNAVDVYGNPYTTGDDSLTNIDVEHPLDDQPRRVAVEFVDGDAQFTFEVLDGEETEDLDVGEYSGLEAWDVNDPRISDTYKVEIVATRLTSFDVQPVTDPVLQGEPLEVEFVNAVDVHGEPYTTGDDTLTNIDVEHPLDDQPRRVAVEFVDGDAQFTFEVLDGQETEDLDLDTYEDLEAWDVNDPSIRSAYDVEIVATRLASFEVEPISDTIVQGKPLEVEFVNAVDIDGEPYTTGDDSWTNIDVEHPLDDQPRRVAVEFVDGEAVQTFEVLDSGETEDLDVDTYVGLDAWDVNDPRISTTYDVAVVATRLASFDVEPVSDTIVQGEPLEVEFVNAVDVDGEPYTTGDDAWTNIDVEHPLDDQPRRVAVEFVDGEALHTFEVLDGGETEGLDVGEYSDLEAWDVADPSIRSAYDVEVVASEDDPDLPFLDADGSGFGGMLAVIALLAAAGIARRRIE